MEYDNTFGIGACCTIARVTDKKITMWWVGDCLMKVYEDKQLVAKTSIINCNDIQELKRQKNQNITIKVTKSHNVKVLNETQLTMVESKYYNVKWQGFTEKVAVIHSLGHNMAFGETNNRVDFDFKQGKKYKIVGASDGVWDMMSDTEKDKCFLTDENVGADSLVHLASARWNKEWDYVWDGTITPNQKIPNRDDICCVVLIKNT